MCCAYWDERLYEKGLEREMVRANSGGAVQILMASRHAVAVFGRCSYGPSFVRFCKEES
jgi:hypothetical protein